MNNIVDSWLLPMAEFEVPKYSKNEVVRAGKVLRDQIISLDDSVVEAFRVAHNWRSAYALPMHRVRYELRGKVRRQGGEGLTAARLKRMHSIRRKLGKGNISLYQIQDIAGARAILPSMADVERVRAFYHDGDTPHAVIRSYDYIASPKGDGYRSVHLVLKFAGQGDESVYSRQFVEIQLRTQKQHAWATAVEAVGLVRNENLKAGEGSPEWLRFFALMSAEIAEREDRHGSATVPESGIDRREELRDLNGRLRAISELESYNQALEYTDRISATGSRFFLINFHHSSRTVSVSPHSHFFEGGIEYDAQDRISSDSNAVLVEVDRVRDLKTAYPNYFLDVTDFVGECIMSISGIRREKKVEIDLSWLSRWGRPKSR